MKVTTKDVYVVYVKALREVSEPVNDVLFSDKAEAEQVASDLNAKLSNEARQYKEFLVATLEDYINESSSNSYDNGYEAASEAASGY